MTTTASTKHLSSLGYVSQLLQVTPAKVTAAAERAGVVADTTINGVRHYSEEQVEALRAALK